ncbi:MAG: aminoacetone oxidase family FAD-binding enzyme [Lachnospiraceae bacterium]|nr:aminoacetone oxidase family FAD-binding enzyme [Lachnospiraceae bacterium]
MAKIIVLGGGPAGIMAAYAASSEENSVTLIERNEKILKKLLLTGNGKCNYSNEDLKSSYYNFGPGHPFSQILKEYDSVWLEEFFKAHGMLTYNKDGLKYPRSEKAETVRDVLTRMLEEKKIETICGKKAVSVEKISDDHGKFPKNNDVSDVLKVYNKEDTCLFRITLEDGSSIEGDKLILAAGGKAYPSTGSDGGGYRLARALGHKVSFTYPVLTRLFTDDEGVKEMSGVRYKCKVSAFADDEKLTSQEGELQFTDKGLSGICIFNISRYLSRPVEEQRKCLVEIDLLPETDEETLSGYLKTMTEKHLSQTGCSDNVTGKDIAGCISKVLDSAFGVKISKCLTDRIYRTINTDEISDIKVLSDSTARMIKHFNVNITGHDSFSAAQVTKGGVDIGEVKDDLESAVCRGLFFAGEVLDVDADCGGYNLHWAFASGYRAGLSAKENN